MELVRINTSSDEGLASLVNLYVDSFPESERRDRSRLLSMIDGNQCMNLCSIIDDGGEVAGLLVYWDFDRFIYLEHFAIFPSMRNHGIGRKLLEHLFSKTDKVIFLEAEPDDTEMAKRRIGFYCRNGFEVVKKDYVQPSYVTDGEELPLWVLAHGQTDDNFVNEAVERIKEEVYYRNR